MAQEVSAPMHDKPRGADSESASTTAEMDLRDQGAVLAHVLSLHPQTLTEPELLREMAGGAESTFAERDRHKRAIRDLAAGGLLNAGGTQITPTRAALLFHELAEL
jgi:hypothetical protein